MKKGSGAKQSNTGNNPVELVKAQLQEVQNELKQAVKSIIEKFPPGRPNSTPFRDIVEEKLGTAPNNGTNATVTIDSKIITQIGKFDTKLKGKVVPYISHRAELISGQKKIEVSQREARLKNLQKKIQEQQKIQKQQDKGLEIITFEQYIDIQIDKQNAKISSFDELDELGKEAKILELKASNSQLQEDLQTLLAEKESSINAQLAIDDNFNLKTEFFNELTKYVTPVVTSSTFLSEPPKTDQVKQSTQLIETALGTNIKLTRVVGAQVTATLNTECALGKELDNIEQTIQKKLQALIDTKVDEETKGLASTETKIKDIQRSLIRPFPTKIDERLLQIKTSVTKKLQEQKEKILELESRIKAEAQQNIEEESKAKAQGQQVELGSDQVIKGSSLKSPAEIKEELAIEEQPTSQGSYDIDAVESFPTDNQGEIPKTIDEQKKLESLVVELQKKVAELSQQLLKKDSELESFRSSNIGSLSARIKELEQRLSKSESDRKNLFGSNNDNLSRLSSANEELDQLKLRLKDYEASDVLVLRAEISNKEAEIAKMRVSIQEVNLGNAQLVVQDAKSRGEISILQQSLEEAQQQNLLLKSQLLEAQLAQTQNAQPLRQEDSISSMLDTRRADSSDDSDSDLDDENFAETVKERAQILQKKRREIIAQNKLLLSENKELLQLLNSVGDELEKFEQLIATTDQKVLSLQQELVAINAQNQQLKSDLVEFKALSEVKVEALEAQLAESKASAEAKAQALEVELGRVIEEAKAINTDVQEVQAEAEAQAKIAQEEKAEAEAKAQEAQERAKLAESKLAEAKAELQRAKAEAEDKAKIAQEAQERAEAQAKTSQEAQERAEDKAKIAQEAQERAEAQALEFKANAQALEVELGGVIEEAKAIATGVQEDQARAKAEAEAKIAEAQAKIAQEAQARAKAEAELQRMELELEQTKAELAKEKARNIESESAKPSPSRSSTIGPAGWPPPPRTSFSRRRPRPSVKLTREMLGEDQGLTVDGRRARLFARSEQGGRRLLGDRRPKSRLLHQNSGIRLTSRRPKLKLNPVSKPETLSPTASVLSTASGADATKSSTVFSKPLPVFSIPARPEITASLLPSMPPYFEKTPPVSNHEPTLPSSLDLEPKKPNPTMTPSSITIFYSAYKRLEEQEDMIKDFLSKIAGGVVSDSYMKHEDIYSQKDILHFFETKGIEFKSYDQALDIIKGVFAKNDEMKNQFAGSAVNISVSHIFKDVFLKQVKEALGPKRTITVSR